MQQYSRVAIFLHWTIAAAIGLQLAIGWSLEDLGARGFALFQLHKSIGVTILLLTLVRVATRLIMARPAAVEGGWQGGLAKAVHLGLYAFMVAAPLTGWALVSTARVKVPTLIFGTVPLPHLPLPQGAHELFEEVHGAIAFIGVLLILLHVAGAIRHHLLLRDGLIWRMVPGRSTAVMALLLLLLPAALVLGKVIAWSTGVPAAATAAEDNSPQDVLDRAASAERPAQAQAQAQVDNAAPAKEAEDVAHAPLAPPPSWTVAPGGKLGFSVGNGGDRISGGFSRWTATIVMDPDRPETADIRVEIDLASASVGDPTQDGMLAGDEFFGVASQPTAVFRATGARRTGDSRYAADGTLTLKGISAPQTIRFTLGGTDLKRRVSGSATIARAKFDVGNGASSGDISPDVTVTFRFEATGERP